MELFQLDPEIIFSFLLTLLRISLLVFLLPFFGGQGLPRMVKAALCLVLTLGLWPHLSFPGTQLPASIWELATLIISEMFLGLTLGIIVQCVFSAVQTAGQIMGFQMGFAMMNVVDPLSGVSVTLTSQLMYLLTILLFLSLNGHLYLLQALSQSFELVPPGKLLLNSYVQEQVLSFSSQIFVLAIKVAAPVMVAEFLVTLGLGIVAKVSPQVNVLFVGFPVKIAVGLGMLGIVCQLLAVMLKGFISDFDTLILTIMQSV